MYDCVITQIFVTKFRYNNQHDTQNVRYIKVKVNVNTDLSDAVDGVNCDRVFEVTGICSNS